jgi:hypothetical protein
MGRDTTITACICRTIRDDMDSSPHVTIPVVAPSNPLHSCGSTVVLVVVVAVLPSGTGFDPSQLRVLVVVVAVSPSGN